MAPSLSISTLDEFLAFAHGEISRVRGSDGQKRILIGVVGPPGAGKSTLAAALRTHLGDTSSVVLAMDAFHLANASLARLGRAERKGAEDTFDADGFAHLLRRIANDAEPVVWAPVFHREYEESIVGELAIEQRHRTVIVEGNYLLADGAPWRRARAELDRCWYLEAAVEAERVERLIDRHVGFGRTVEAAKEWVLRSDEANARVIAATRGRADQVLRLQSFRKQDSLDVGRSIGGL